MNECIFCKIAKKEIPSNVVYEDETCFAFLDINPSNKGHTLVIPKKHFANFDEIDAKDLQHIIMISQKINHAIRTICEGTNILINNGTCAGQTIYHFHLHIIPKHDTDDWSLVWPHKKYDGDINLYAERIRSAIKHKE